MTAAPIDPAVVRDIAAASPRVMLDKPFDVVALAEAVREIVPPAPRRVQPTRAVCLRLDDGEQ